MPRSLSQKLRNHENVSSRYFHGAAALAKAGLRVPNETPLERFSSGYVWASRQPDYNPSKLTNTAFKKGFEAYLLDKSLEENRIRRERGR